MEEGFVDVLVMIFDRKGFTNLPHLYIFQDANYNFGGIFDPSRKDLRRNAMETIFGPFESLVDNTLYGRNFEKKRDGQVGGVKNIVVTDSVYSQQRAKETNRNRNMEIMISKFLDFQNRMIKDTI